VVATYTTMAYPASKRTSLLTVKLLQAAADALNALDAAGLPVQMAHNAILTDAGYVFAIGRGKEAVWQVRTRQLTEFQPPGLPTDPDLDA
jgi:hypothetical protein